MSVTAAPEVVFSPRILRALRLERGLSQHKLARASHLSLDTIQAWEQGACEDPRGASLVRVARTLKCAVEALFEER